MSFRSIALCFLTLCSLALSHAAEIFTLTSAGGNFTGNSGRVTLNFAPGLVAQPTDVFLCPNPFVPDSGLLLPGTAVSIGRPKFFLTNGFTLRMKYDVANLPPGTTEANLAIHFMSGHRWKPLASTVDTVNKVVTATIKSAGTYGLLGTTSLPVPSNRIVVRGNGKFFRSMFFRPVDRQGITEVISEPNLYSLRSILSPRLDSFVFVRRNQAGTFDLYQCMPDGSFPTRITNVGFTDIPQISVAPNGIFFAAKGPVGGSLILVRGDLAGVTSVLRNTGSLAGKVLAWSFDSNQILTNNTTSVNINGVPVAASSVITLNGSTGAVLREIVSPTLTNSPFSQHVLTGGSFSNADHSLLLHSELNYFSVAANGTVPQQIGTMKFGPDGFGGFIFDLTHAVFTRDSTDIAIADTGVFVKHSDTSQFFFSNTPDRILNTEEIFMQ